MSLLTELLTDSFADSVGFTLPPAAFRIVLQRSPLVQKIRQSIRHGAITEAERRKFVADRVKGFKGGEWLEGDLALAALAVAVENLQDTFAEEFLNGLAKLKLAEMPTAIRIARECLKHRKELPKTEVRTWRFTSRAKSRAVKRAGAVSSTKKPVRFLKRTLQIRNSNLQKRQKLVLQLRSVTQGFLPIRRHSKGAKRRRIREFV